MLTYRDVDVSDLEQLHPAHWEDDPIDLDDDPEGDDDAAEELEHWYAKYLADKHREYYGELA